MTSPVTAIDTRDGRRYVNPLRDPSPEYFSVTQALKNGVPKPLANWAKKVTAEYAVDNVQSWQGLARDAAVDLIKREADRVRDGAADRGSLVHEILEAASTGQRPDPVWQAEITPYVNAGLRFLDDWQPDIVWAEFTVYSDQHLYAGTSDLICHLPGLGLVIADYKTSNGIYAETGLQLAAYRFADYALAQQDGAWRQLPIPAVNAGVAIHLRADGTYAVVPLLCDIEQHEVFLHALQVARFTTDGGKRVVGPPMPAPTAGVLVAERRRWVIARIEDLRANYPGALDSLAAMWPAGVPTLKQDGHTLEQLAAITQAVVQVEAAFEVPFPAPDPSTCPAPAEMRGALIERLKALPADLADAVSTDAKAAGVPHLGGPLVSLAHVERLEPILSAAERETADRMTARRALAVDLLGGDVEIHALIIDTVGDRSRPPTAGELDLYEVVARAVAVHPAVLQVAYTPDGTPMLQPVDAEARLVALHGSKAPALAACRDLAARFGLAAPRSVAAAAGDPVLTALALSTSTPNTQALQEQAS